MPTTSTNANRRFFLKAAVAGGLGSACPWQLANPCSAAPSDAAADNPPAKPPTRVALTAGNDRADNVFRGLKPFAAEIARAICDRRVVIKPNNVAINIQLSATHAEALEGILEFLKSIGKVSQAVIAESAANGPTLEGFANYGYPRLAAKYGVKLLDLDAEPHQVVHVFDEKDFRPHPVRASRLLLDPRNFLISAAKLKTHDLVVSTLSLKNILLGAPVKSPGFSFNKQGKAASWSDKPICHGSGIRGINYNLFALAQRMHPHLAVIDGYDGMEGHGPSRGTPVDHRVCVVGTDWLAADRVAVELMGIDFAKIGYLNYCAQAGMGEGDLKRIEIVGPPIAQHVKRYKLAPNIDQQLVWMKPPQA
jgi:uncharacterized protein (DUF362 family)